MQRIADSFTHSFRFGALALTACAENQSRKHQHSDNDLRDLVQQKGLQKISGLGPWGPFTHHLGTRTTRPSTRSGLGGEGQRPSQIPTNVLWSFYHVLLHNAVGRRGQCASIFKAAEEAHQRQRWRRASFAAAPTIPRATPLQLLLV